VSAAWFDEYVVAPYSELVASIPVRGEVSDLQRCDTLAIGIEGLFRAHVRAQYGGWPPESTTDGTAIQFCVRPNEDTLDVAGVTWIDFDGSLFPSRAEVRRTQDRLTSVTAYIGEVDARNGAPPRMPPGTLIVPVKSDENELAVPHLILGRRQLPITWTKVFEVFEAL
jgi:hypothetical protein